MSSRRRDRHVGERSVYVNEHVMISATYSGTNGIKVRNISALTSSTISGCVFINLMMPHRASWRVRLSAVSLSLMVYTVKGSQQHREKEGGRERMIIDQIYMDRKTQGEEERVRITVGNDVILEPKQEQKDSVTKKEEGK